MSSPAAPDGVVFGELLREHRLRAGLTQEQLAERAGYSTVYISMLERCRRQARRETSAVLARVLELGPRDTTVLELACRGAVERASRAGADDIVGRGSEMAEVERHLRERSPPVLLISGEPGIGKSAVLRRASSTAGPPECECSREDACARVENGRSLPCFRHCRATSEPEEKAA